MKNVLIAYGSTDGQTAKIATAMATTLLLEGCRVDVVEAKDARLVSPRRYDAVIVAASVHAGGYQKSVVRWVRRYLEDFVGRPSAFISVCLGVLEHKPETDRQLQRILREFEHATGWVPGELEIVAGALPYTRYGWLKKRIMRRIAAKAAGGTDITRDYEYTDWDDLRTFVRGFAERHDLLPPMPVGPAAMPSGYTHQRSDY